MARMRTAGLGLRAGSIVGRFDHWGFLGIVGCGSGSPRALVMSKAAHKSDKKGGIWTCFQALWQFYAVRVGGGGATVRGGTCPGELFWKFAWGAWPKGSRRLLINNAVLWTLEILGNSPRGRCA